MTRWHFFYTRFMDGPSLITQFITIGLPKLPNSDKFVQTSLAPARVVSCFQTDVIRRNQPRVCHRKAIMKPLPRARVFSAIRRAQNKQWRRVGKCLACEFVFFCVLSLIPVAIHVRYSFFFAKLFCHRHHRPLSLPEVFVVVGTSDYAPNSITIGVMVLYIDCNR